MKYRLSGSILLSILFVNTALQAADFTEEFQLLKQADLQSNLSGKTFSVKAAKGPVWKWQFNQDETFTIDIGNYSDSGKWSTKDSSVCQESKKGNTGCNEIRVKENALYLKRDNGEIVLLQSQ